MTATEISRPAGPVPGRAAAPASPAADQGLGPLVSVRGLGVAYGDGPAVLDGVDLDLYPGEVVALLGASGSGKSTLMKSLTGFAPITAGTATVAGVNVASLRPRALRSLRAQVGQVFQQYNLVGRLSVMTNVLAGGLNTAGPLNLVGAFPREQRRRALDLLERVGIADKASAPARTLSGGQQQRVAIARALMQKPALILADEPVASLDPAMSWVVLSLLRDIARTEGIPVLISLHVMPLALEHADRIVGLRDGRALIADATERLSAERLAPLYAGRDGDGDGGAGADQGDAEGGAR